jgi:putative transcriptional regulator
MFHYVACGLPNIWLANGYTETTGSDGVAFFSIAEARELHRAIGHFLTEKESVLTGDEFRFLRSELRMSRKTLAELLGYSDETIKKWESAENRAHKLADANLRQLFLEGQNEDGTLKALLTQIKDLEREERRLCFEETQTGWEGKVDQCA